MSLIIHTICKDGIVVASDTRRTIRDGNGHVRYDDTEEKTVPFPNNVVVSYCGDSKVNNDLTVMQFLYGLRKKIGNRSTILDLPLTILTEYVKVRGINDSVFLVSGHIDGLNICCTYRIFTKSNEIRLSIKPFCFGSSYDGMTDVAHAIMNSGIDYSNLSIKEAIDLTKTCLCTNLTVYTYNNNPGIGGSCQVYVIDVLHSQVGWLQDDGIIVPDDDAPSDGLERYRERQQKRFLNQLKKEGKLK